MEDKCQNIEHMRTYYTSSDTHEVINTMAGCEKATKMLSASDRIREIFYSKQKALERQNRLESS